MDQSLFKAVSRKLLTWSTVVPALLVWCASSDFARGQCGNTCGVGEVEVEFRARASLIKGTTGSVRITFAGTPTTSAPKSGGRPLPFEPESGQVGAAGTDWAKVKISQDQEISGTLEVTPTGTVGAGQDYDSVQESANSELSAMFKFSNACGLLIEFSSTEVDMHYESDWRELTEATFIYHVPTSQTIHFKIRARKKDDKGNKDAQQNNDEGTSPENTQVSPPTIPEQDLDNAAGLGGQPGQISPPEFSSGLSIHGGAQAGGYSAGSFELKGPVSPGTAAIGNLSAYELTMPVDEFDLVEDTPGEVRQVRTPAGLYDVQPVSGGGVQIKFYTPGQFTAGDEGELSAVVSGQIPRDTVSYTPVPAGLDHLGGIRITRTGANGTTHTRDVLSLSSEGDSYRIVEDEIEVRDYMSVFYREDGFWYREDLETVKRSGLLYAKTQSTSVYQFRTEGSPVEVVGADLFLLSESVFADETNSLTTTWAADPDLMGRPKWVIRPDGSWEAYSYYDGSESGVTPGMIGLVKETLRPWKDAPAVPDGASSSDSVSIINSYDIISGEEEKGYQLVSVQERGPGGVTMGGWQSVAAVPTDYLFSSLTNNGGLESGWMAVIASHIDDNSRDIFTTSTSSGGSIREISARYDTWNTVGEYWNGRQFATLDAEGNGTVTGYERGGFYPTTGAFLPDPDPATSSNGQYVRSITLSVSMSGTSFLPPVGEATKVIEVEDLKGRVWRHELWILSATSTWSLATVTTYTYDEWSDGSIKEVKEFHDGRLVSHINRISGTTSEEWDEQGIKTILVADAIGQVVSITTEAAAAGTYAAQPARVTTYSYVGRATTVTSTGGDLSMTHSAVEDLAGREIREIDPSGAVIATTYSNGGIDVITSMPGEATRKESRYRDGRLKSVTGTAVVNEVYDYTVITGGFVKSLKTIGNISTSTRSNITISDWGKRTVSVSSRSPHGWGDGWVSTIFDYAVADGHLTRRVMSEESNAPGVASLLSAAPEGASSSLRLIGYDSDPSDSFGQVTDRMTQTSAGYEWAGGYWWKVSYRTIYDYDIEDPSRHSTITSALKNCVNGNPGSAGVAGKSIEIKPTGETITTTTTIDFDNKTRTDIVNTTASNVDAITVNHNGLVVSQSSHISTSTVLSHDGLGNVVKEVSPLGAVSKTFYRSDGRVGSRVDHYGNVTRYDYNGPLHHAAGKLSMVTDPAGKTTTYGYSQRGEITEVGGTSAYKVTYQYDDYGAKLRMFTWRNATTADETKWNYEASTGLLLSKQDASGEAVTYTYHPSGKLSTRTWARGVSAAYSYNLYGDLTAIDYDGDGGLTPDITFPKIDQLGRPKEIEYDSVGSENLTYQISKPGLARRYYSSDHAILPQRGISLSSPSYGRPTGFQETSTIGGSVARTVSYSYDSPGRLQAITEGSISHVYGYRTNTPLVASLESKSGSTAWFKETRYPDVTGRLTGIRSDRMNGGSLVAAISAWSYDLDSLGRRTKATFQDGSSWNYTYNDRSEVLTATRKDVSPATIPEFSSAYTYDGIGNRLTSTSPILGNHGYGVPNQLNQYDTVTTPAGASSFAERVAIGRAPAAMSVEVFADGVGGTVTRPGSAELYASTLTANNTSSPKSQVVLTKETGQTGTSRRFWYAKASITPTYDEDGNLLNDGRWVYTWDAENRLIQMETTSAATAAGHPFTRLRFSYDWQGRRIARTVWEGGTSMSPTFSSNRRWLYDGWNPIAEFSATSETTTTVTRLNTFTWGLDLGDTGLSVARPAQPLQGAGGVGGLLMQASVSSGVMERASYDGNGNIIAWTKSNASIPTSRCEFDAFGNVMVSEGSSPSDFGFSTKMQESETGLLYYGYRYYQPEIGRWISRDPIEEKGGVSLYGFVSNDGLNKWDLLGLQTTTLETPSGLAFAQSVDLTGAAAAGLAAAIEQGRRCNQLRQDVKRAKQDLGGMGGCKDCDSPETLAIKTAAWCALATARWVQLDQCFTPSSPGYEGHKMRQELDYDQCEKCRAMLGKN